MVTNFGMRKYSRFPYKRAGVISMRKLRCLEPIQCKSIYRVYQNSRRTDALIFIYLSSSKFVRVRRCSARYLKAWAERNVRCFIGRKMGNCWKIVPSEVFAIIITCNSLVAPESVAVNQKSDYRWGSTPSGMMILNAVGNCAYDRVVVWGRDMNALRCFTPSEESGFSTDEEATEFQNQQDGMHSEPSSVNCGASSPARTSGEPVVLQTDLAMERALALVVAVKQSEYCRQEMYNCGV